MCRNKKPNCKKAVFACWLFAKKIAINFSTKQTQTQPPACSCQHTLTQRGLVQRTGIPYQWAFHPGFFSPKLRGHLSERYQNHWDPGAPQNFYQQIPHIPHQIYGDHPVIMFISSYQLNIHHQFFASQTFYQLLGSTSISTYTYTYTDTYKMNMEPENHSTSLLDLAHISWQKYHQPQEKPVVFSKKQSVLSSAVHATFPKKSRS